MAVLAALGGVSSTYVNTIGDAAQAALGFPGSTQWAAGLHTIWIVLAMGILNKTGTGTVMGIVKGTVELMSGNTHGIIILLTNLVAGLLVDFGFFIFRNKRTLPSFLIAGGLSAGSNVLVFQIFATLPTNILAIGAILLLTLVAAISGVLFSGFAPFYLVKALIKANVVKQPIKTTHNRKFGKYVLMGVLIVTVLLAGSDAGLLLEQIRGLIYRYQKRQKFGKSMMTNFSAFINWILQLFNNLGGSLNPQKYHFGYSAEIWQRSSAEVFKTVGDAKDLQLSPPLYANTLQLNQDIGSNLHIAIDV